MKQLLILILSIGISFSVSAQGFFKPDAKPKAQIGVGIRATPPLIENVFHPIVGITASTSDGTQLAGGVGVGYFHRKWDDPSQTWVTQYSISGIGFLDTKGSLIAGVGVGFLSIFNVGWGYNFMSKSGQFLTGITIQPF